MPHHSTSQPHPSLGHGPTRIVLLAAVYVPTVLIALILYRAIRLDLIPALGMAR